MELDPNSLDAPRTRWLDCGGVRFLIRYVPPIQMDRWRKKMIHDGILRETRGGGIEAASGRETAFYRAVADTFVENWDGNIVGNPPYSAEIMGRMLAYRDDVWKAILGAITEQSDFFVGNGNGSMTI